MTVTKVNVLRCELDEHLDEAGFRHAGASLGARLGARTIGAGLYEAEAGVPIWPYHYHHGVEEWLYVLTGAPVLREPAGERVLAPGEAVRFPSGPRGAHTVSGPGRFVIFDTGRQLPPWMSVYPDSGKVSGPEGILLASSAVGYWHGEGTAGDRPAERGKDGPLEPDADRLDATVVELAPGEASEPYHYVHGREDWLMVLAGAPTLRHPGGEEQLEPGDLLCLPEGPAGARRLHNAGESVARTWLLSTTGLPVNVHYPDTGRWVLRNGPDDTVVVDRAG